MGYCTRCGKEEDSIVSIIQGGDIQDYGCFSCAMEDLKTRLKGVPITIDVPDYPEYTQEELSGYGAAINYQADLVDYPPHKKR